jgi:hypothetical protein
MMDGGRCLLCCRQHSVEDCVMCDRLIIALNCLTMSCGILIMVYVSGSLKFNFVNFRLVLLAHEDCQLRPKHVEL